jgi:sulfatase maturation enzyme AslB (radical SAM superfamily)
LTISERLPLAVVFLISRRCNLQCSYCNVEAGPQAKGALEPHTFESWIGTFGELGDVDLGIQLHGGEPLLLDPSVELLASIARNAVVPYSRSAVGKISIVTNGTLLDADRARSLVDAGLHVVVSVDGPQHVHDRHRVTGSGRGTHQQAMRGVDALRSAGADPAVIAVISEPSDVANVLRFFISIGLSRVKINPVRPEGRGTTIRGADDAAHMLALADAYFNAAKMLAAHNQHAQQPTYEENIALLLARAIGGGDPQNGVASWTLLLDDRGRLWSHPGGYGVEHMALTEGETPSPELL